MPRSASIFSMPGCASWLLAAPATIFARSRGTVWLSGCASWYLDPSGRNSTLWPGFTFTFRHKTSRFDPAHFELRAAVPAPLPART